MSSFDSSSFFDRGCYDIAYNMEKDSYIATGDTGGAHLNDLAFSTDGLYWIGGTLTSGTCYPFDGSDSNGLATIYSNNLNTFFAGGGGTNTPGSALIYSKNGTSWDTTIMNDNSSYPFGSEDQYSVTFGIAARY